MRSPFEITKAVDLEDPDIDRTYVSFRGRDRSIVDPSSVMPQFLTGLKGGGRTHLMRHYSYPLQRGRATSPLEQIQRDGYVGVYFRCSGLNGSRFSGKGQTPDTWRVVFAYYMDLWITELLVATVADVNATGGWSLDEENGVADSIRAVLGISYQPGDSDTRPFRWVLDALGELRNDVDRAVNNAAHTARLNVEIRSNPGELLFSACKAVGQLPGLEGIRVTFLADEYENLDFDQQVYFNTLIREKQSPATFLIGGRSWGIKTHRTLSAGEENKKGSEYELAAIEDVYSRDVTAYERFCRDLVLARLRDFGLQPDDASAWIGRLGFQRDDRFLSRRLSDALSKYEASDRPHLRRLRSAVTKARTAAVASDVVEVIRFPEHPLLEKLAILRLYQQWAGGQQPSAEAAERAHAWVSPLITGDESPELANFFKQRKSDAVAQIYRDVNRKAVYAGFSDLVAMSGFLPRSLLMILKYVAHWADFNGEDVFHGASPISEWALSEGVRDAAQWYLTDATPLGSDGVTCETAITRLGVYFQALRYSDKPTEINITTFSTNMDNVSPEAREVLDRCVDHGLLVNVGGRSSRNHGSTHRKFQLHPMLTPLWGLSSGRRGDATLTAEVIESIFSPSAGELPFRRVRESLELEVNAPFTIAPDSRNPLF